MKKYLRKTEIVIKKCLEKVKARELRTAHTRQHTLFVTLESALISISPSSGFLYEGVLTLRRQPYAGESRL